MLPMGQTRIAGIKLTEQQLSIAVVVRSKGPITADNVGFAFPGRIVPLDKLAEINRFLATEVAAVPATTPGEFQIFRKYNSFNQLAELLDDVNRGIIQQGMRIECTVEEASLKRAVSGLITEVQTVPAGSIAMQWILTIRTEKDQVCIFNDPSLNELSNVKIYKRMGSH